MLEELGGRWREGQELGEAKLEKQGGAGRACARSVVSDSLQPRELRPARILGPWNFPGKNTGVGCHFLHQQ